MIIYRDIDGVKTILHDLEVDGQTELQQSISGSDLIDFKYTSEGEKLDLQIGDYTEFKDSVYQILNEPNVRKSQNTFTYNIEFKSDQYILENIQVMIDQEAEFSLFGNAIDMVSLILSNLNRVYTNGLYYADYVEETESKLITFNNENCLAALQRLATEFECEFTVKGKKITFRKKIGQVTDLVFRYRKNLREIERQTLQNAELLTVLYPFGSMRNITNEYGSRRLKIPKIENNVNIFGTIERSVTFEDVYPRFKGMVSSSSSMTLFTDTGIDFNINEQLMGGMKAKVVFNSGDLSGREFEISSYNNSTKTVELIPYTDDSNLRLPNEVLRPRVGDKYVFINIKMPQSYIDNAEAELLEKATEYLEKYSQPNVIYKISPHHPELRRNNTHLNLGDIITIQDEDFGVAFQTRILNLNQKRNSEFDYKIDVGNQVTVSYFTQVLNDTRDIRNNIYQNSRYWNEQFNRVFNNIQFKQAVFVNMGAFSPTTYYHNNQNRIDYVYILNQAGKKEWYYFIGADHTRGEFIQANWQFIGDNFEIIATETLLAENANIGDWIIQNGMIVSQAVFESTDENEVEPRVQLNGREGYIRLVSAIRVYTDALFRDYKQTIMLDSRTGQIIAHRAGDSFQEPATAILSSNGLRADFAGWDVITPPAFGATQVTIGKAAVLGDAYGKLSRSRNDFGFVAGVVGKAVNISNNPAPAYGGVFWGLKSFGRYVGIERLPANITIYKCGAYEEVLSCYNYNELKLFLPDPSETPEGRVIKVKRVNANVKVIGKLMANTERTNENINKGDMWTFINDGLFWLANYQGRTDS